VDFELDQIHAVTSYLWQNEELVASGILAILESKDIETRASKKQKSHQSHCCSQLSDKQLVYNLVKT